MSTTRNLPEGEPAKDAASMIRAEIWCWLNGWCWPGGRPAADEVERDAIRVCFRALHGFTDDGLRLWRERHHQGLDPVSGGARR